MKNEFISSLESLAHEHGIDMSIMRVLAEESLRALIDKNVPYPWNIRIEMQDKNGRVYGVAEGLTVVKELTDPAVQITEGEAKRWQQEAWKNLGMEKQIIKEGAIFNCVIPIISFGRIGAGFFKQKVFEKIHKIEREAVREQFRSSIGELLSGNVSGMERGAVVVDFQTPNDGIAKGVLSREDRIPGEKFDIGDFVTAQLVEIYEEDQHASGTHAAKPRPAGAFLHLSRSTPQFVSALFEREVTEIADGLVEIKAVSREAGYRSKLAVASSDPRIDPSGACIGLHGNRVRSIIRELGGEKVDVIEWNADPKIFISNALKPAELLSMDIDAERKVACVYVTREQLSLAIGKKGQNARLASRLTGWKIDIVEKEVASRELTMEEKMEQAAKGFVELLHLDMEDAKALVAAGYHTLDGLLDSSVEVDDLVLNAGFSPEKAVSILEAAKTAQAQ